MSRKITLASLFIMLLFAACTPPTPVRIVVTPTPSSTEDMSGATPSTEQNVSPVPSAVIPMLPTSEDGDSVAVAVTPSPTVGDDATMGPVIGEDYHLTPSSTPGPTRTSTPSPTPRESATPSVTPAVTSPAVFEGINPDDVGIQVNWNMDIPEWEQVVTRAKDLGVTWLKVQADWSFLQPEGPDQFDLTFQLFENHMERAKRENFRIMISIAKAPDWARSNLEEDGPPDNPEDLANFIRFLLNDTKVGEVVDAIEIWNEPNLQREWNGTLPFSGAGYMQLFVPAYNAIREYPRHIDIISAALAPTSNLPGAIDDRDYLQQMYNAGFAQYRDLAMGAHPYGWGNPPDMTCCDNIPDRGWDDDPHFFFMNNLQDLRDIMVQNGHDGVALWVTELGWATWSGFPNQPPADSEWMLYNTPRLQAEYMLRALEIGGETQWIGPIIIWNLNFAEEELIDAQNEIAGYSLILPDGRVRPLYEQLKRILNELQS